MQLLNEWITNIILFILLATILELLLPNSSFQRFVKMVVGLMLLVIILNPLLSIFSKDPEDFFQSIRTNEEISNEKVENLIESKKTEIEMGQRAYISEQVAVQMKRQVEEELVQKYGVKVQQILISMDEFATNSDFLQSITEIEIVLRSEEAKSEEEAIKTVPVVSIDTSKEYPNDKAEELIIDATNIKQFLSDEWQIPKEVISLALEGGNG